MPSPPAGADSGSGSRIAEDTPAEPRDAEPPKKAFPSGEFLRDERGAISVLMLGLFGVLAVAALGVLALQLRWQRLVARQLKLDHCVERTVTELRSYANAIQVLNAQIKAARIEIAALMISAPEAVEPAKELVRGLVSFQEVQFALWKVKQGKWLLNRGCEGEGDFPTPLPSLDYLPRGFDDALGPRALEWRPGAPTEVRVRLASLPRASAARIHAPEPSSWGAYVGKGSWRAEWCPWANLR